MRKKYVLLIGITFFGSIYFMLAQLDRTSSSSSYMEKEDIEGLHSKLAYVEMQLEINKRAMDEVRDGMEMFLKKSNIQDSEKREELQNLIDQSNSNRFYPKALRPLNGTNICPNLLYDVPSTGVNMIDIYKKLPFDDKDGGVWKQGFPIETSDAEWHDKKLKVFVVPHSHNDPGWIKTLDKYFTDQTQHILNNIVDALSQDENRRFIWAEMSYLSMWWNIATPDRKIKMKKLIDNGQLEIVTGGWVMNDEANTHYFAMIDQMIEGNEWLSRNLDVIPRSGWAIDPFGHSSVMAYLLKKMKFDNMLIQRVHYAIKKHFAAEKLLEFRWRQAWCDDPHTDIVCHMMPFYSYDVPHTCGPDPKICCQFDFARLPGQKFNCPWKVSPVAIDGNNVADRSALLLDQYRKKSKLFQTNTLLVILGDDFRYSQEMETKYQFENYAKIFAYVNSHPSLNAELKFGTLTEYFDAMKEEVGGTENLPSLAGEFFTYADRQDHYWSGYYVSRPFHKMQDRVLESHLRGAEILFSFAFPIAKSHPIVWKTFTESYKLLVEARRNLGLFQHHDGITGTAKEHVVVDYGNKLMGSVMDTKKVQAISAQILLSRDLNTVKPGVVEFEFEEIYSKQNQPPDKNVIQLNEDGSATVLVIYNSLAYDRTGVVNIYVSTPNVAILSNDQVILSQTNLVWRNELSYEEDKYQVQFLTTVPGSGLVTYKIKYAYSNEFNKHSTTKYYNTNNPPEPKGSFQIYSASTSTSLSLENDFLLIQFTSTGLIQQITDKLSSIVTRVALEFVTYISKTSYDNNSGAYLFLPTGPAQLHVNSNFRPIIRQIIGPLSSSFHVVLPNLLHKVTLYQGNGDGSQPLGIHICNEVDIRSGHDNKEIAMRLSSDIESDAKFYTDLNGFQMQQRTYYDKLPLQANFYPMPAMAFIQDKYKRLSLMTAQPLGAASLKPGQLEVIMERRLMKDDNRGLGQGVKDNVLTPESFVILLENWNKNDLKKFATSLSYPSIGAHQLSWELLHPFRIMSSNKIAVEELQNNFEPFKGITWPCDVHLLNLRTIQSRDEVKPTDQSALLLHRVGRECQLESDQHFLSKCPVNDVDISFDIPVKSLFKLTDLTATSLSLQEDGEKLKYDVSVTVKPMEIEAFKVKLS